MPRFRAWSPAAVLCLAVFVSADCRSRSASTQRTPLSVRSSLDRTAAWVGDPVTFTVEIVCSPGYDIFEDDLARDRLPLEGLEMRAADMSREARDDGTVLHRARFQLASYTPERENLRVGPLSIRYYRKQADARGANQIPIGSVEVAAENIALRSTLPESVGAGVIRTPTSPAHLPRFIHLLYPLGLALVALPLIAGGVVALTAARRRPPVQADPPAQGPTDYRIALNEIRRLPEDADPVAIRLAFGRLDRLVREILGEMSIDARTLTPDEIDALAGPAGDRTPHRAAAEVLRECDRARFAGPKQPSSRDRLTQVLDQAVAVVSARGRMQ